jgi:hypothetical protein
MRRFFYCGDSIAEITEKALSTRRPLSDLCASSAHSAMLLSKFKDSNKK